MGQCATGYPPRSLAKKEQTLPTKGTGLCTSPKPHYNQPVITGESLSLLPISSTHAQVAGRLKYFQANWNLITDDPWVLETIMGYKIEFHTVPRQVTWPRTFMSIAQQKSVQVEADKMIPQEAIHPVTSNTEWGFVSSIFLVDREDGGRRPVINLRNLNSFCGFLTFQNGGNLHVKGPSKKRRFYGKTEPQSCILYCPSLDRASKVLEVPFEGNCIGICMSAL